MTDIERLEKIKNYINNSPYLQGLDMKQFEIIPFTEIEGINFQVGHKEHGARLYETIEEAEEGRIWEIYNALKDLEYKAELKAEKEKEFADKLARENLQGYEKCFTRMQLGKVLKTLDVRFFWRGDIMQDMSRRELVEKYYKTMELSIMCKNTFYSLGGFNIGKTAYEYCQYLQENINEIHNNTN